MPALAPTTYMSPRQAADAGYGGYSTLLKYIREGTLPAQRVGRRLRLRTEDLEALLKDARTSSDETAVDAAVARVVNAAPRLSGEQIAQLAAAFGNRAAGGASNR